MNFEKELSILILSAIAILSALVAYQFYISKDGRLRILIIRLFATKVWVYGGAAILMSLNVDLGSMERLILNLPMFFVMLQLWQFIRTKE